MTSRTLIIGAGPGGIAAAIWLHNLEMAFDWIEQTQHLGGALRRVGNLVDEIPGTDPQDGPAWIEKYRNELDARHIAPAFEQRAEHVTRDKTSRQRVRVTMQSGQSHTYNGVLICTGTTPRSLGLTHETEWMGRGVERSVTRTRARYANQHVAVVGGGDGALEGALLLAEVCASVHLIHRDAQFAAQNRFIQRVRAHRRITIHPHRTAAALLADDTNRLCAVRLDNGNTLRITGLFIRIGVRPQYPDGLIVSTDAEQYLPSDTEGRGPLQGTYVVGDVGAPGYQSVSWAIGSAARAVATLSRALRNSP